MFDLEVGNERPDDVLVDDLGLIWGEGIDEGVVELGFCGGGLEAHYGCECVFIHPLSSSVVGHRERIKGEWGKEKPTGGGGRLGNYPGIPEGCYSSNVASLYPLRDSRDYSRNRDSQLD